MSDQTIETPGEVPDQQPSGQQTAEQRATYWENRYKGTGPTFNKLTQERNDLRNQVTQLTAENEELKAQLSLKDTEKTVALGERDKHIQNLLVSASEQEADLKRLRALERKLKVTKDLHAPELIEVMDTVPDIDNEEVLKTMMENILNWGKSQVTAREKELLAGITGSGSPAPVTTTVLPTNVSDWQKYVSEAADGSEEKRKRFKQWSEWGASQH